MAIDADQLVATYETEYLANAASLAALPAMDFSDKGRSVSAQSARDALTKRQDWLAQQLAALGAPIGGTKGIGMPFVSASRMRPRGGGYW